MSDQHLQSHFFAYPVQHHYTTATNTTMISSSSSSEDQEPLHQQHHHHQTQIPSSLSSSSSSPSVSSASSAAYQQPITASTNGIISGSPPANYIANIIARNLLPHGASMFGRKSDANCILRVGRQRYHVHVQMLAARSPTFRKIFDEMIANEAWGPNDGYSNTLPGEFDDSVADVDEKEDDLGLDYEDPALMEVDSPCDCLRAISRQRDELGGGSVHAGGSESELTSASVAASTTSTTTTTTITPITSTTITGETYLSVGVEEEDMEEDQADVTSGSSTTDSDESESLPELVMALTDPVGSRFDELLYWIYTDDGRRWEASFTPENYKSILENIIHLNLATPSVLEVCERFESSTRLELGLRGKAQATLLFFNTMS
ncbi:hypothetical protein BGX23_005597 [Mortierella sp. AD031]|nr:hypothetical protein BGX23_005597 [Mortierella sp. AD031]